MRYEFTIHPDKSGWYMITDTKWMMVCEFQEHLFNETQNYLDYGQLPVDPQKIATAMREMGDWLYSHHYAEIFQTPTFELKRSDDDQEILIIRHKRPHISVSIPADDVNDLTDVANNLRKMAEFLNKRVKNAQSDL